MDVSPIFTLSSPKSKLAKLLPEPKNVACRSMLAPAVWRVVYPDQRGASTAGAAPTIVGRVMWEVKRGAVGVGHEKNGQWRIISMQTRI